MSGIWRLATGDRQEVHSCRSISQIWMLTGIKLAQRFFEFASNSFTQALEIYTTVATAITTATVTAITAI